MRYLVAALALAAAACTASNPSALPQPLACACEAVAGERGFPGINGRDGEPGAQGPKGDKGEPGAPAVAARVPHLVTDAGDDLGIFVGNASAVREVAGAALYVVRYDVRFSLAYQQSNCNGEAYLIGQPFIEPGTDSSAVTGGDGLLYRVVGGPSIALGAKSYRWSNGTCTDKAQTESVNQVVAMGIAVPPFRSLRVELR